MVTVGLWLVGRVVRCHRTIAASLRIRAFELESERERFVEEAVRYERDRIAQGAARRHRAQREHHGHPGQRRPALDSRRWRCGCGHGWSGRGCGWCRYGWCGWCGYGRWWCGRGWSGRGRGWCGRCRRSGRGCRRTGAPPRTTCSASSPSWPARPARTSPGWPGCWRRTGSREAQPGRGTAGRTATTGVRIDYDIVGDLRQIPGRVAQIAYRVLQEGLTNAVRHAPGAAIEVNVSASTKFG